MLDTKMYSMTNLSSFKILKHLKGKRFPDDPIWINYLSLDLRYGGIAMFNDRSSTQMRSAYMIFAYSRSFNYEV